MYSAGALTVQQRDDLNRLGADDRAIVDEMQPLYDKLGQMQGDVDAAAAEKSEAGNDYSTAQENKADRDREAQLAEGDFRTEEAEARAREREIEQRQDAHDADRRNVSQYKREQLDPIIEKINQYWDLANFQFNEWARRLFQQEEKAKLEAVLEQRHALGAILLAFHAASSRLGAAVAGVSASSGLSAALSIPKYMTIPERLEDDSRITRKQLDGLEADRRAKEGRLAELDGDTYTADKLRETEKAAAEARAKRDSEKVRFDAAEAEKEAAKAEVEDARAEYQDSEEAERDVQAYLRGQQDEIRAKQAEREKIGIDRQKIQTDASVDESNT